MNGDMSSPLLLLVDGYVSGYVAHKIIDKTACVSCKQLFGSIDELLDLDISNNETYIELVLS